MASNAERGRLLATLGACSTVALLATVDLFLAVVRLAGDAGVSATHLFVFNAGGLLIADWFGLQASSDKVGTMRARLAKAIAVDRGDRAPVPCEGASVPCEGVPVPCEGVPVPCDRVPVPCEGVPVPCDRVPVPCDRVPIPCEGAPVFREGAQVSHDGVPQGQGRLARALTNLWIPVTFMFLLAGWLVYCTGGLAGSPFVSLPVTMTIIGQCVYEVPSIEYPARSGARALLVLFGRVLRFYAYPQLLFAAIMVTLGALQIDGLIRVPAAPIAETMIATQLNLSIGMCVAYLARRFDRASAPGMG